MSAQPSSGLHADLDVEVEQFRLRAALTAEPGETVAVLGPNGAGKSTTVRSLTGLEPLTAGRIELGGRVLDDPATKTFVLPHERSIGTAFQDALLFPHLDVRDNVGFGLDRSQRGSVVDSLLDLSLIHI